jgi:hypothetical protein
MEFTTITMGELDGYKARIAALEAALAAANADAEALFGWTVLASHDYRCKTRYDDTAVCSCGLQDDLQAHVKRAETNDILETIRRRQSE